VRAKNKKFENMRILKKIIKFESHERLERLEKKSVNA